MQVSYYTSRCALNLKWVAYEYIEISFDIIQLDIDAVEHEHCLARCGSLLASSKTESP